ncbi:MAG: hypothetical protein H7A23_18410 [Leptospiraceae bacterium]|nr:hypothetical protein [Leptospiraceae bacterium]MCP5496524.1 hypothetical protein [Leptospiraceae bacterium]
MANNSMVSLTKFEDLSFFDNLALYHLGKEVPPNVIAQAMLKGEPKTSSAFLSSIDSSKREEIYRLMAQEKDSNEEQKDAAISGILLIAENLISKNVIVKKGKYYFGV